MAAGDAVVGALRVVLGTDTAQFEEGLKSAGESLSEFAKKSAEIATGIQLSQIVDKLTESLTELVKTSIEGASQMGKLSQRIGVPVDSLTSLATAAAVSDVNIDGLAVSMGRLARSMTQAASGGVGPAASAFMALGISSKELRTLKPEDVIQRMADAFSQMKDGADKTAIAIAVFGRAGQQMIPLLNLGAKGLDDMRAMALALGLVITENTAKAGEKFVDSTKLMALSVQGVANTVAAYFLPSMAAAAESMVHWIADGQFVAKTADVITRALIFIGDNLKIIGGLFALIFGASIVNAVIAMGGAFVALARTIALSAASTIAMVTRFLLFLGTAALVITAVAAITGQLEELSQIAEDLKKGFQLDKIGDALSNALKALGVDVSAFSKELKEAKENAAQADAELKKLKDVKFDPQASEKARALTDELSKLKLQSRETLGEFSTLGPGFVQAALAAKLFKNDAEAANFTLDKMTAAMQKINTATLGLFAAQQWKLFLDPMKAYELQMNTINAALAKFPQLQDALANAAVAAAAKMRAAYADAGAALIGGFASVFQALGTKSKSAFEVWKALATAQAVVAAYAAANQALAQPPGPPISYAYVAAAIATGIANVIKIQQTQFTGAAKGGEFTVPGGNMGIDTRMVSMALAPGELVKVTPADQARGGGGAQQIEMKGIRPNDLFTGEMVRGMFEALNRGYSDGYRVKFA